MGLVAPWHVPPLLFLSSSYRGYLTIPTNVCLCPYCILKIVRGVGEEPSQIALPYWVLFMNSESSHSLPGSEWVWSALEDARPEVSDLTKVSAGLYHPHGPLTLQMGWLTTKMGDLILILICFYFFFLIYFLNYIFIFIFMAVLGLRFCVRAFSSCGERGPLFIAVHGPLTVAASLVAEHRLQTRRLSNCGSRVQLLRGMWDPPRPGLEPVCPALAGRFSTTAPPGKPCFYF